MRCPTARPSGLRPHYMTPFYPWEFPAGVASRLFDGAFGEPVGQQDGDGGEGYHEDRHHIGDRALPRLGELAEHPDGKGLAPRSMEASISDPEVRRKRASTLLYTTTIQKVAWPTTMVQKLNGRLVMPMAERSAMPLTIPGSAIGSTSMKEIASRPKNRLRYTAAAARVPRASAIRVATRATRSDSPSASQTSARLRVTWNQSSVSPGGGKLKVASSVVKA